MTPGGLKGARQPSDGGTADFAFSPTDPPAEDGELTPDRLRAARTVRRLSQSALAAAVAREGIYCDQREVYKLEHGRPISKATAKAVRAALATFPVIGPPAARSGTFIVDQERRRSAAPWNIGDPAAWGQARRLRSEHWAAIRRTLQMVEQVENATPDEVARARAALRALDETPLIELTASGVSASRHERTMALLDVFARFREITERMTRAAGGR